MAVMEIVWVARFGLSPFLCYFLNRAKNWKKNSPSLEKHAMAIDKALTQRINMIQSLHFATEAHVSSLSLIEWLFNSILIIIFSF